MRNATVWIIAALVVYLGGHPAAAECAAEIKLDPTAISRLIECMKRLEIENAQLNSALTELKSASPEAPIPALNGAVVAFDLKNGCPRGWIDLGTGEPERFAGRTVIAAGPRVDRAENGTTLKRSFNDQGGAGSYSLGIEHLPPHSFTITSRSASPSRVDRHNAGGHNYPVITAVNETLRTDTLGQGQALPTLDPFVALHLCRLN